MGGGGEGGFFSSFLLLLFLSRNSVAVAPAFDHCTNRCSARKSIVNAEPTNTEHRRDQSSHPYRVRIGLHEVKFCGTDCQQLRNEISLERRKRRFSWFPDWITNVQEFESQMEKFGNTTQKIPTKKYANVGRASRNDEKLLSTSAKHDSGPQTRRRERSNTLTA